MVNYQQKGVAHLLILLAALGLIVFILIANLAGFKGGIFQALFPKQASLASGVVELSVAPSQVTAVVGNTFTVDVAIDTHGEQVSAAEFHLTFDSQKLSPVSIQNGSLMPLVLSPAAFGTGTATITLGTNVGSPVVGTGTIFSITFTASTATNQTPTLVSIDASTQVAAIGKTSNVLGPINNSTVTINNPTTNNNQATFSLSPTNLTINGGEVPIVINFQSDSLAANTISAKLRFDPTKLQVSRIDNTSSNFPSNTQWGELYFDNALGQISVLAGIPTPGLKTSGSPIKFVTVYLIGKATGATALNFDGTSSIYDDTNNTNIIAPNLTGATINVTAADTTAPVTSITSPAANTTVSGTITITANATDNVGVTKVEFYVDGVLKGSDTTAPYSFAWDTTNGGTHPCNGPHTHVLTTKAYDQVGNVGTSSSVTVNMNNPSYCTGSPSPSSSAGPTPTPPATACTITSAKWTNASAPVNAGVLVTLDVTTSGTCTGQQVSYVVKEDDGLLGFDLTKYNPSTSTISSNTSSSSWISEYQPDGLAGVADPPEFYFTASLVGGSSNVNSIDPKLQVLKPSGTTVRQGDINQDGVINLQDLSIMLSNWNKNQNLIDAIDLNNDGVVNTIDFSTMLAILRAEGILAPLP